ncbi:MAG: site-2 protease family protein [Collinsella sp.]|nr:site-2 protease family protein [Collinsella sp.]
MEALLNVLAPIFWGVLLLSVLVFLHEGGHFLAARLCGVRVTEFFLGLPFRYNLSRASRRIGTRFGVTPLLLGGYAAISGMDPEEPPHAAIVLDAIHRQGEASVPQLAEILSISEEEVLEACAFLLGWGSIAPVYGEGESRHSRFYPTTYASLPRDGAGNTVFDGRAFARDEATGEGQPWIPPHGAAAFLESERSRTYLGVGFWKRAFMLVAGVGVNLICGVLFFVVAYSVIGIKSPMDVNVIGSVAAGSPSEAVGLESGDRILAVDGIETNRWTEIVEAIGSHEGSTPLELLVWEPFDRAADQKIDLGGDQLAEHLERDGATREVEVAPDGDGLIGIGVTYDTVHLNPIDSTRLSLSFLASTAQGVGRLLMPQHTVEVLDNSASLVGISVMSAEAAEEGASAFLSLAALISFSLGFMNLLPIPPLDGGKLLIEAIQALSGKPVPIKVQTILSYIGIVLFGLLFLYMLRSDILRFI